jgi:putative tryptophan/tyrosine transport system substrate-binding protein
VAGWTEPADRVSLGERRRSLAPQRSRAGAHAPRPDPGDQYAGDGLAAGAGPKRADHVRAGGRPGGNITGFTNFEFSIGTKWLEALKQIAPRVTRVALIYNPETAPYADLFQQPVEAAAPAFAVMPITVAARSAAELERAIDAFAHTPNGGLLVLPDVTNLIHRDQIIALAARHRLPAVYPYRYYAASGGLLSYGSEQTDVFRRAASYVDRILKGTSPGELPVQAPTKYELVINLQTAKTIGIEVPATLLATADEVIE